MYGKRYIKLEKEQKMKSRKVLTILLSLAIMLTFMPTMAFAVTPSVDTPDELTKCTYTVSDGSAQKAESISEAMDKVYEDGTVTVEGTVNNDISIPYGTDFNLDLTGATLAEGVEVTTSVDNTCLVNKGGLYVYHDEHNYNSAEATASKQTGWGNVVLYCANGHEHPEVATAQGHQIPSTSDKYDLYQIDEYNSSWQGANGAYRVFNTFSDAISPTNAEDLAMIEALTWEVSKDQPDVYTLGTVDYVKDGNNVAVKDSEGKTQFFATYRKNGEIVLDEKTGKAVTLTDYVVKSSVVRYQPTVDSYGTTRYSLEFVLPDGTKEVRNNVEAIDIDPLAPKKTSAAIQYLFKDADGNEFWGDYNDEKVTQATGGFTAPFTYVTFNGNVATQSKSYTDGAVKYNLVMAEDGNLTYRIKYGTDKSGYYEYGDPAQTTLDTTGTPGSDATKVYGCGKKFYLYNAVTGSYESGTNINHYSFNVLGVTINSKHEYALRGTWAEEFKEDPDPTHKASHSEMGYAYAKCQYCDYKAGTKTDGSSPSYTYAQIIPKLTDHKFKKDANDKVIEKTVAPTCTDYGFTYRICTTNDGNWIPGNGTYSYTLALDDEEDGKTYTFKSKTGFEENEHPVLVEGTVKDKIAHKYYVVNEDPTWGFDLYLTNEGTETTEVTTHPVETAAKVELTQRCMLEPSSTENQKYVYHQLTFAQYKKRVDPTAVVRADGTMYKDGKTHVFNAIGDSITEGKDCTKLNKVLYTVKGVTKSDGSTPITQEIDSQYGGPHTYTNTVTFSKDGKTASVTQQCTVCTTSNTHVDKNGNKRKQYKEAVVKSKDNEDGSTTYTATVEGLELTNNTKTVFDLTKAEVVINEGKELDLNTLPTDTTAKAKAFKKLVAVSINGAALDSDLYYLSPATPVVGVNTIQVVPAEDSTAVGTAKGTVKCIQPEKLWANKVTVKDDGKVLESVDVNRPYNKKTVEVEASEAVLFDQRKAKVDGVTIQLAFADSEEVSKASFDESALDYYLDKLEFTEVCDVVVFAKLSKEGFTTTYQPIATVKITKANVNVAIDDFTMTEGEDPDVIMAITGNDTAEKSDFTVQSYGGQALKDLKPGTYRLAVLADNYTVTMQYDPGRYGSVTVLAKGGLTPDEEAKAAAEAADKALGDAAKITTAGYTADSVKAVKEAEAALRAVLAKEPAASTEEIKTATAALNDAIAKAVPIKANDMKVKVKKTIKTKTSKKKVVKKAVKVSGAEGAVTIKKANKAGGKKIVVKNNGKVIVKKGLKKGTYKVKVKVTAAGDATHKAKTVNKTIKVIVK
jgi:hypothetical protein